jgi:hypothetical protein
MGGGVVAAVPSEGGALLSPFAEWLASLVVDVPPGNCDCQALGIGGCGGFSSSSFCAPNLERDRDFDSLRGSLSFSSFSPGWRLHLCVSAVSPDSRLNW